MKIKSNWKLRKPSGIYNVGCTNFIFKSGCNHSESSHSGSSQFVSSHSGSSQFVSSHSGARIIPCLCFYPAEDIGTVTGELAGKAILKNYISEKIIQGAGGIKTNSYLNVAAAEGRHPLVLYNHAYAMHNETNTVQCEELASNGYIVLCVGHQGEGQYELPASGIQDGGHAGFECQAGENASHEIMKVDMQLVSEFSMDVVKYNVNFPEYSDWLRKYGDTACLEEHRFHYGNLISELSKMKVQVSVWIQDDYDALEALFAESEKEGSLLYNRIDRNNIGTFGMSFGGAAAVGMAMESPVIKACADLDGFLFYSKWDQPIKKPALLMQNDSPHEGLHLTFPFVNAEKDAYLITVESATHNNFNDYNELLEENHLIKIVSGKGIFNSTFLGSIDADKMERILNSYLLSFFNKYLKGLESDLLDGDGGFGFDEIKVLRKQLQGRF